MRSTVAVEDAVLHGSVMDDADQLGQEVVVLVCSEHSSTFE